MSHPRRCHPTLESEWSAPLGVWTCRFCLWRTNGVFNQSIGQSRVPVYRKYLGNKRKNHADVLGPRKEKVPMVESYRPRCFKRNPSWAIDNKKGFHLIEDRRYDEMMRDRVRYSVHLKEQLLPARPNKDGLC